MQVEIHILGAADEDAVLAAGFLFDQEPIRDATRRFLNEPSHHLLIASDESGKPVGFVSGVETTHPDKGTEMFLYEIGVDLPARRQGVGGSLVEALAALAAERGCYGMWTATEPENVAALKTYKRVGATTAPTAVVLEWGFNTATRQTGPSEQR